MRAERQIGLGRSLGPKKKNEIRKKGAKEVDEVDTCVEKKMLREGTRQYKRAGPRGGSKKATKCGQGLVKTCSQKTARDKTWNQRGVGPVEGRHETPKRKRHQTGLNK